MWLLLLGSIRLHAQDDPVRSRLMRWYHRGECDSFLHAVEQYQRSGKVSPSDFYEERFICYERTYRLEPAVRWVEQVLRSRPEPRYRIDLAYLYNMTGHEKKAARILRKVLKEPPASVPMARYVGHALTQRGFLDEALGYYQKAARTLGHPFCEEIGTIHHQQKAWTASWEAWFRCAEDDPAVRQRWQAFIQDRLLSNPERVRELKRFLIGKAQRGSESAEELLAWLYMQSGDYQSAFRHLKALDRRRREQGRRILSLAASAQEEGQKGVALSAYQYVLNLGPSSPYYHPAYSGWLRLKYEQFKAPQTPPDSIAWLEQRFYRALGDPLYRSQLTELVRRWGYLRGVRMKEPATVMRFIDQQLRYGRLSPLEKGELLLQKGDLQVQTGQLWEAWLTYSKVEKDHKGDLTDRARLRKAWLAFYMGNFDHALLYTDVLKGGTDKYVANDAMALELLIKDHRDLASDTTTTLLRLFARAHLAYQQENFSTVFQLADSIMQLFPPDEMKAALLYLKGQTYQSQQAFDSALEAYSTLFTRYPDHILADDAVYHAARIYDREKQSPEKAFPLYEKLIFQHPSSIFTAEIRKRYRTLRQRRRTGGS